MTTKATLLAAFCLAILLFPTSASTGSDSCRPLEPAVLMTSQAESGGPVSEEIPAPGLIGVSARIVPQPDLPFEITSVSHSSDIVTRDSSLRYSVTNRGGYPLTQLSLLIVQFDSTGKIRAVQKTGQALDVAPGKSSQRDLRLSNLLYANPTTDYAEFAVAVMEAQTGPLAWRQSLPLNELTIALNAAAPVPVEQADVVVASECPGICLECRDLANSLCGPGCTQSFACSRSTCSCSFTCRPGCNPP